MKKLIQTIFAFMLSFVLIFAFCFTIETVNAENVKNEKGQTIYYPRSNNVPISVGAYVNQDVEFRATWVSFFAGDISGYSNDNQMKQQLLGVLAALEEYHMNAIVFHIRTHNDALYPTDLAPQSGYVKGIDYEQWDYLEWFINECHKRGIEFHAWLNPYRISSSITAEQIAMKYANCPKNPASKSENVLMNTNGEAILDPGRPEVQDYIVDVCMEICEKYDIDAIHFDDYFYIDGVDDSKTRSLYNTKKLSVDNFRRASVDAFIEKLSNSMAAFNKQTGRAIQLGISPSAIYRNVGGNYVAPSEYKWDDNGTLIYPLGTATSGFAHYGEYLYCDTKKWIDNEWIDYIIPQVYNGFSEDAACYATIVEWWNGVCKNKKTNLYIGTGLYKKGSATSGTWNSMETEWYSQLRFNQKNEYVDGTCVYQYKSLTRFNTTSGNVLVKQACFTKFTNVPVAERYAGQYTTLQNQSVQNLKIHKINNKVLLTWDKLDKAKSYVIYQYNETLYLNDPNQIIGRSGNANHLNYCVLNTKFTASKGNNFAVVAVTPANELCQASTISINNATDFDASNYQIATFSQIEATGSFYPTGNINIRFNDATIEIGTSITYEAYVCYGTEWKESEAIKYEVLHTSDTYYIQLQINKFGEPYVVKIKGTTEFGSSWSEECVVNIQYNGYAEIMTAIGQYIETMMDSLYNTEKKK